MTIKNSRSPLANAGDKDSHTWERCPVCGLVDGRLYVEFPQLSFRRCVECQTIYKSREVRQLRPAEFYEEGYFHGRKSGRDRRFEHRVRKAKRWIRDVMSFAPGSRSLLDVGCSFGYVIEAAKRLGLEGAGLDISRYAVEHCQKLGYDARVGTLEGFPFATGSFDVCIMKHVLEHTPTPRVALEEVGRILTPAGIVLVAVPDVDYWKGSVLRKTYRYYRPDDLGQQHYVYYCQRSLMRLLDSAGFEVLAASKDHHRKLVTGPERIFEPLRFAFLRLAYAFVRSIRFQRELFVIARKKHAPFLQGQMLTGRPE